MAVNRSRLIDISRPLGADTPTWPGDSAFESSWTTRHEEAVAAVSRVSLSPHLGSHADAPLHLDADGADAASLALDAWLGPCEVLDFRGLGAPLTPALLPPEFRPRAPRILLATGCWPPGSSLPDRFASFSPECIDLLADQGVVLVGVDGPSVDGPGSTDLPAHRRCIDRGVAILEGLDLTGVGSGLYTLVALPLRLERVEASPVRAVLIPLESAVGR